MDNKAIIFDMDGVLIDSEPHYQDEIIACFKELGIPITKEALKPLAGGTDVHFQQVLTPFLQKKNCSLEEFNILLQDYSLEHPLQYTSLLNSGVYKTLTELKKRGILLALASSSPKIHIDRVLDDCGLTSFFQFTISGEVFHESKPHPEIYLTALKKLALPTEQVIAIEDSTYGIQAAKSAGLFCIAKRDERYDYQQDKADILIDEIPELLHYLNQSREVLS